MCGFRLLTTDPVTDMERGYDAFSEICHNEFHVSVFEYGSASISPSNDGPGRKNEIWPSITCHRSILCRSILFILAFYFPTNILVQLTHKVSLRRNVSVAYFVFCF